MKKWKRWAIQKGKRVNITVKVGDIWKDSSQWLLQTENGVFGFQTKGKAIASKMLDEYLRNGGK